MVFRTIMVPVDGSSFAENALSFALSIARKSDAAVHIALVHVPSTYAEDAPATSGDLDLKAKQREGAYLAALEEELATGFRGKVQFHHLEGVVPETLAEEVLELRADLVVMNIHGWGYISRALFGSVSDYLMRHLHVPLLLMHTEGAKPELTRHMSFRRILIPLDGSELAETILRPAQALGGLFQAEYRLLRVVSSPQSIGSFGPSAPDLPRDALDQSKGSAAAYLEKMAQSMRDRSLVVETHVVVSHNVTAAIVQEASYAGCDLIAISTHGRGGLSRLAFGSVADKVLRGVHTPVLVFHAPQPAD
jgi:nucleotide-binding universal stress UspA family protein